MMALESSTQLTQRCLAVMYLSVSRGAGTRVRALARRGRPGLRANTASARSPVSFIVGHGEKAEVRRSH